MAYTTRTITLNSTRVSKELLRDLEDIFEKDLKAEIAAIEAEYFKKVQKRTKEIEGWNVSQTEKEEWKSNLIGDGRWKTTPTRRVSYEIISDEQTNFNAIKEILDEVFLPEDIRRIEFVLNTPPNGVSIRIVLKNELPDYLYHCTMSSQNRSTLLEKEEQIKRIFEKHRTSYSTFLRKPSSVYYFSALISVGVLGQGAIYISRFVPISETSYGIVTLISIPSFVLTFMVAPLFNKIYPYFSFELNAIKSTNSTIRAFLWLVVSSVVINALWVVIQSTW